MFDSSCERTSLFIPNHHIHPNIYFNSQNERIFHNIIIRGISIPLLAVGSYGLLSLFWFSIILCNIILNIEISIKVISIISIWLFFEISSLSMISMAITKLNFYFILISVKISIVATRVDCVRWLLSSCHPSLKQTMSLCIFANTSAFYILFMDALRVTLPWLSSQLCFYSCYVAAPEYATNTRKKPD